jgi:hypothetical protein
MSDEKDKAPIHPAVALNDPRGGLFILDGGDSAMPVHVDDMTDEQLEAIGLERRKPVAQPTEPLSTHAETALIDEEQHDA